MSPYVEPLLTRVTNELCSAVRHDELGFNLGMTLSEIEAIEREHQDAYRRLIKVINWWLERQEDEEPHIWRKIIECVKEMGKIRLARQISDRYVI